MSNLGKKIKVVLTALPTWAATAAVVVAALSEEISQAFPHSASGPVHVIILVLTALTTGIGILRRVTPVLKKQIGILPQAPPPVAELDAGMK